MEKDANKLKFEIDKALVTLTETIEKIKGNLNTHVDDTATDLFYKMSDTRNRVDEIAEESRNIFIECLNRCIDSGQIAPTVKWDKNEYGSIVKNRFSRVRPPCEICGETRKIEFCHIIPRQLGGSNNETNILYLCPTHHSCFDSGVLSENEWNALDWRGKSEMVNSFVNDVLKMRQIDYWNGKKVYTNIAYMGYAPLTIWVREKLEMESVDKWNKKRNNHFFKKTGKNKLG